ncbi:MAG: molecular chaperone DnaJ [Alphaproteobacteria bacterium]|jgi:molecular chaperone DnaJ|nr:molecular chaperone DnaJ [Alphaproteobacteria bacterium]
MSKRDYYEVLGVARGCSAEDLKSAYRKLAMECHPDRNPGDHAAEHKFKELSEAYEILKDPDKRAAYERFGHAAFEGGHGGRGPQGFDFAASFTDVFDDLFGEFMGGGRRGGKRQNRGGDLRYNLEITLEDAYHGKSEQIRVPSAVACEHCGGNGAEPGSKPETCATCAGHGKVRASQGFFTIERTCPKCRGQGRVVKNPCKPCNGVGHVQKERTLSVDIPPGVEEGTRIRLTGEGQGGMNGGPPGDLYIFLSVQQHPIFQRDAQDLYCRVPIGFITAALGGEIEIPTLSGMRATVSIPEGTQTGHQFKLRGRGMPLLKARGHHGDLFVEVRVETPVKLSKKQKELLRAFEAESPQGCNPDTESFFAKMKEFLAGGA